MMETNIHVGTTDPAPRAAPQLDRAKLATRLAFFIAGFGLACWAPLVPYAKARLGVGEAELGSILLFLGIGSVIGMPAAGYLAGRLGNRIIVMCGAAALAVCLPLLAMAPSAWSLSLALLVFGAAIGGVDVAANMHGTEVQTQARNPLMSGFHGFYSIGGLAGAAAVTLGLSLGLGVLATAAIAAAVVIACLLVAVPGFLAERQGPGSAPLFVVPHGVVIMIGSLAGLTFLAEGAMLDWGAILLAEFKHVPLGNAGAGYSAFALAMTLARVVGDRFVARMGDIKTLGYGALLSAIGIALAAWADSDWLSIAGFALTGLGAANIVPVLFTLASRQRVMPVGVAISAVSTLGYLGVFVGPAMVGHVAAVITLPLSFGALAVLMLLVAALSARVVRKADPAQGDQR